MRPPSSCPKCGSPNLAIVATEWSAHTVPQEFRDREGTKHVHDPKTFVRTYRCGRGHEFRRKGRVACPAGDFPRAAPTKKGGRARATTRR